MNNRKPIHLPGAVCGLLLVLIVSLFLPVQTAQAASFTVNDAGDAGDQNPGDGACRTAAGVCTLRAAVDEANAAPGPHTITIPAMTIVLGSELRIADRGWDESVHFKGAGKDQTILDGGDRTRIFFFAPRSGSHAISDLTIRNARNPNTTKPAGYGGGIFNEAELAVTNVKVTNSRALEGGGIYNQYAFTSSAGENIPTLRLKSVELTHNQATTSEFGYGGGGLFNGGVLTAENLTITNNSAAMQGGGFYNNTYHYAHINGFRINDNVGLDGGGIDNDIGELRLVNGEIRGNVSNCCRPPSGLDTGGGGIYNNLGYVYLENVDVSGNKATSPGGYGAGIYNANFMELVNVSLTNNEAAYGAGIFNGNYDGTDNKMTLTNVTLSNNRGVSAPSVDAEGGAIYNTNYGKIYLYNSTVTQNYARVAGGIANRSTSTLVELTNTILAGNTADYPATDCRGTLISQNHNLIGNPYGMQPQLPCSVSLKSQDLVGVDPLLGALAQSGALSFHPLLNSSPAVDRADDADCPSIDSLGTPRPMGAACDIGAIELEPLVMPKNMTPRLYLPMVKR